MSAHSEEDKSLNGTGGSPSKERVKQKIRIKYKERVRIKKRPEGNKVTRYWKKNKKNIITTTIVLSLLLYTIFMILKVAKHKIDMNKYDKDIKQEMPQ
ncbi:MAG: hypothetical protein K9G41_02665 [Flavobacteriales bacterium]|nr:hypothetical protein [Flavobacteriales bacterium]